jgi:hypothetical protein
MLSTAVPSHRGTRAHRQRGSPAAAKRAAPRERAVHGPERPAHGAGHGAGAFGSRELGRGPIALDMSDRAKVETCDIH